MALFILINTVTVGSTKVFAGDTVNDAVEDANAIRSAGGLLWPASDSVIAAAAADAVSARLNRGANEAEIDAIMQAAVDAVQLAADTAEGPVSVVNAAAITAMRTAGLDEGADVYVKTYKTPFKLRFAALTLRAHEIVASDDPTKVWVRSMAPSEWTFDFDWHYNKDTGDDEGLGTEASPIKSLDEWCRRVRVMSAGTNGVQAQYLINLQTDTAAADTWFPSGLIQADGVQIGKTTGEMQFQPTIVGFRRAMATPPGGSGALTAASALASTATRAKATLIDTNAVFTTLLGRLIMCADTATAASGSGAAASLAGATGIVTLTGGTGFTSGSVNRLITITGAATPANNGTFPITKFVSAASAQYSNPAATATDANNGAISWVEKASKVSYIANAPAFTTGAGVTVTAVNAGIATIAGAPAATFTSAAVGKRIRFTGGIAANNVDATILEFVSATSVKIANVGAVVDATSMTFQGIVEVGPTWFDNATLLQSAAAPSSGSPYVVIQQAIVSQRSWGAGKPNGMQLAFTDCELTTSTGLGSGQDARLTYCRLTNGGFIAGAANINLQSMVVPTLCCWVNPSPGFGAILYQEAGVNRPLDTLFVGYNIRFREAGTTLLFQGSMIQGGYLGPAGEEVGGRPGSALGWTAGTARGLAIFNNVENSATNPSVASGSAGAAAVLARGSRAISAGNGARVWGIGALIGLHIKEDSKFASGAGSQPTLTDSAGQAGYPVSEIKFGAQQPIPVPSATTGVPAAVATTSGVATTFVALNGIVTITDAAAVFTAASVGRTVTIAGANTAANNGTYVIQSFIGATSVTIRNPAGVTDAVAAGTMTENAVITRWSQLGAAPYTGNARNYTDGSAVVRVVEI